MRTGKKMEVATEHSKQIKDMQLSVDGHMLISASISPLMDDYPHVVVGGGQEAMEVTMTSSKIGKFDARFFHLVFEEEFARVKGHFGPINSLAFHPNGRGYASGAEDGFIRVHVFDDSYYQYRIDY